MVLRPVYEKRHGGKDDVCAQTAMNIPIYLCPMILQKETLYNTKQNNAIR